MKIKLHKLKIHPDMSEETICFSADIHINGKLVAHARNSGRGGSTDIHAVTPALRELLEEAEKWAVEQPPLTSKDIPEGLPMNLEFYIDMLVQSAQVYKENKRQGFVTWETAKTQVHEASGINYPELHLWHKQGTTVFHPQPTF